MPTPTLPAFWAYASANVSNVTGDGTAYDVVCDTEQYDNYNQYDNSTGVFTAGFARTYLFSGVIGLSQIGLLNTSIIMKLVTSLGDKVWWSSAPTGNLLGGSQVQSFSRQIVLDAGDTVKMQVVVNGSAKVVDIMGGNNPFYTEFGAVLLS
jgi:hypothetical protein